MGLIVESSVDEFFHGELSIALNELDLAVSDDAQWYLVGLMGEFTRVSPTAQPLALRLAEAVGADDAERARSLKEVGDTSLYLTGFFPNAVAGGVVDSDYYMAIGSAAYRQLAERPLRLRDVFDELSQKFGQFSQVLGEVRRRVDGASDDVTTLYEQWLRTRDAWIERKLLALGVLLPTVDGVEA